MRLHRRRTASHTHEWKAVRFEDYNVPEQTGPFGSVTAARDATRVGFECDCGVRTYDLVLMDESAARWMYRAELGQEPTPIPDAILSAFGESR